MLDKNLIKLYEQSFRENREMAALTDYFKGESFSYYEVAKEVAKLHLMFKEMNIERGDKIALIGRNNTRWCISYIATITYGATIVPILQDFNPIDATNIINHSDSRILFLSQDVWDKLDSEKFEKLEAVVEYETMTTLWERNEGTFKPIMDNVDALFAERSATHTA